MDEPRDDPNKTPPPTEGDDAVVSRDLALDVDILAILGSEPAPKTSSGAPLHSAIASRWTEIMKNGIAEGIKEELIKKHPVPENLGILKVPILNPEVAAAISTQVTRRDVRLVQKQTQLSTVITAVGEAVSLLLEKGEGGNHRLMELLSDAGRLLCDFHHNETTLRKELISINLNRDIKNTLSEAPTDQYLFGETLEERIKAAKNLERSSLELRPAIPKVAKNPTKSLNVRRPSRPVKGARVGQQMERAPYRPYRPINPQRPSYRNPQVPRWKKPEERRRDLSRSKSDMQRQRQ